MPYFMANIVNPLRGLIGGRVLEFQPPLMSALSFKDERDLDNSRRIAFDDFRNRFRGSVSIFIAISRSNGITPILMTQANGIYGASDFPSECLATQITEYSLKPSVHDYRIAYAWLNAILRQKSSARNVEIIDLGKKVPKSSEYIYDSVHLTEKGSLLAAQIISQMIHKLEENRVLLGSL